MLNTVLFFAQSQPGISAKVKVRKIDSLKTVLVSAKDDTNKVNTMSRLFKAYLMSSIFDSAEMEGQKIIQLALKINWLKGEAGGYNNLGVINHYLGKYPKAREYYFKNLKIREEQENKATIASANNNIAKTYFNEGNYPKSLDHIFKALKIAEEIKDKKLVGSLLNDVGNNYFQQESLEQANEYYLKALKVCEETGDKQCIANENNNIGTILSGKNKFEEALPYYEKALKIKEEIGDKKGWANSLDNIGGIYFFRKDYKKALDNYLYALEIMTRLGEEYSIAPPLNNVGRTYSELGKMSEALKYCKESLEIGLKVGSLEYVKDAEKSLAEIYKKMNNTAEAFKHYQAYIVAKDSLFNEENTKKTVRSEMNFVFEKQQAAEKAEQDKKNLVHLEEFHQQKLVRNMFIFGFVLMLILAFLIFRNYKHKKQANELLAKQKEEIELQKLLVEEKNREVLDSIKYAQRIQKALLTSESYIKNYAADFFILNKPKDIVSGDFYWAFNKELAGNEKLDWADITPTIFYLAIADCTGHGVPGAFMSMLNVSLLNETIIERKILKPNEILNHVRSQLIKPLSTDEDQDESKNGMDRVLCAFDFKNMKLHYAAANNAFYLVRDKKLIGLKADKMPVGIYNDMKPFTMNTLKLQAGDCIYTFTDGYADQFGGNQGKKFKYKQFENKLCEISELPLAEQKNILDNTINEWKEGFEQVDDMLVVGIKV